MPDKFQGKYRIASARLQSWDYGANGAYFITICTKNRKHFFGEIENHQMILNDIGKLAEKYWMEIPAHFTFIELGEFVIMPNHTHGILIINKTNDNGNGNVETRQCLVSTPPIPPIPPTTPTTPTTAIPPTPWQLRFQNQRKNTISSITGSYKSVVSKNARLINKNFAWQPLFYDNIIWDAQSFETIQNYIANNPKNWKEDRFF